MADRNHKMLCQKRLQNELMRTKAQALPDNSGVRKTLLGDWATHMPKRG